MDGEFNSDTENLITSSEEDVELTGCAAKPCCNPTHWLYRFMALLFMSLLGFGKIADIPLSVFSHPESHRLLHVLLLRGSAGCSSDVLYVTSARRLIRLFKGQRSLSKTHS
jgi:hypothetical protein